VDAATYSRSIESYAGDIFGRLGLGLRHRLDPPERKGRKKRQKKIKMKITTGLTLATLLASASAFVPSTISSLTSKFVRVTSFSQSQNIHKASDSKPP